MNRRLSCGRTVKSGCMYDIPAERKSRRAMLEIQAQELDLLRTQVRELRHGRDLLIEYLERECGDLCNAEYNPCNARYLLNRIMELK